MRMKKSRKEIESSELNKGIALVANSYGSFLFWLVCYTTERQMIYSLLVTAQRFFGDIFDSTTHLNSELSRAKVALPIKG